MRFATSLRLATIAWTVIQACTTYDDVSTSAAGSGNGGVAGQGAESSRAGGGNPNGGNAGSGNMSGGKAGASSAGSGGNAGTSNGGSAAEGGAPSELGGAGGAAEAGAPAVGMGGAAAGEAGAAGAGGASTCISAAPDVGCSCEAFGTHDYWFCSQYLTFAAAENKCKSVNMHLPKIETQAEDAWLFAEAPKYLLGEYWLGATDATTPNEWSWLAGGKFWSGVADGTALAYAHWSANEPNASGDCLVVQGNGPWDDRICTDQRRYVCESQ